MLCGILAIAEEVHSVKKDKMDVLNQQERLYRSLYEQRIITDPQGSYTGLPADPYDVPVQDADDL